MPWRDAFVTGVGAGVFARVWNGAANLLTLVLVLAAVAVVRLSFFDDAGLVIRCELPERVRPGPCPCDGAAAKGPDAVPGTGAPMYTPEVTSSREAHGSRR
jgi:hypothetical protein